jgi:L-type amino acid transporter 5
MIFKKKFLLRWSRLESLIKLKITKNLLFIIIFEGILGFVNMFNLKFVSKVQIVFTISKTVALLLIIGAGVYTMANNTTNSTKKITEWFDSNDNSKKSLDDKFGRIALSLYSGLYTYSGWYNLKNILIFNH